MTQSSLTKFVLPLILLSSISFSQSTPSDTGSFRFPLSIGDSWRYFVQNNVYPGMYFSYNETISIESDTIMPNGKRYYQLPSMYTNNTKVDKNQFLRKDSLRIYQYCPEDSNEYLRFDFSAKIGDTIASFTTDPFHQNTLEQTSYIWLDQTPIFSDPWKNLENLHIPWKRTWKWSLQLNGSRLPGNHIPDR